MDEAPIIEQRSAVKIGQTAKGEPVVEVKIVEGFDPVALEAARLTAIEAFKETVLAVGA